MNKRWRVVLVSTPGLVQRATEILLASCPEVEVMATAPGALSATRVLARLQPDLLLIDATMADAEIEALLAWVKAHYPEIQCAALTATSRQTELVLEWGADIAVHRSCFSSELIAILDCQAGCA